MRVKVGNRIYDGKEEPVMVILTPGEKRQIADMAPEARQFCVYPSAPEWTDNDYAGIKGWMKDEGEPDGNKH